MEEFYPMPLCPKLYISEVANSAQWYTDALGFRSVFVLPSAGGQAMNHLRLERYQDLLLIEQLQVCDRPTERDFVINLSFSGDLQSLADQARKYGGKVEGPAPTRWNTLEVTVEDPNGFVLTFSTVLDASRKFADVMAPAID